MINKLLFILKSRTLGARDIRPRKPRFDAASNLQEAIANRDAARAVRERRKLNRIDSENAQDRNREESRYQEDRARYIAWKQRQRELNANRR
jgi:hypothetical protein